MINRCSDCYLHYDYCRHQEDEFINVFNRVGAEITEIFGNAEVIGNNERVNELGGFDVYVRGIGPNSERDEKGRYYLFRKGE